MGKIEKERERDRAREKKKEKKNIVLSVPDVIFRRTVCCLLWFG